jgi:hypothetical protein
MSRSTCSRRRSVRTRRRLAALLTGCALFLFGAAGTAAADSLVFIKDGNVWLSQPDGSGQYQVTLDGTADNPYVSPSQADDGTIVAARKSPNGGPLYRMRQNGELLGEIPVGALIAGPFAPQVSPDGQTIAYEQVFSRNVNGYYETSSDVRFTRTDGSTAQGFGEVGRGAGAPSWIDSGRAFVGINQIATTVVPGQAPVEWWNDYQHQPKWFSNGETVEDGEVAPNGNVAVVRGEHENNTIQIYRSTGFTSLPTPTCTLTEPSPGPAGKFFVDPTFSPSGDAIAWQEGNGVWAEGLPANCSEGKPHLLIPGASEPDWGPAAVNPGPRALPTTPAAPVAPTPPPVVQPGKQKPGKDAVVDGGGAAARVLGTSLPRALAQGLKLRLEVPGAGTLTGVAQLKGRPVATGSRKVSGAGKTTLALRFSKAARTRLAGADAATLHIKVRFRPARGKPLTDALTVNLKR